MNGKTLTVLMMGKTGSGKGTQSKLLADKLGCSVFSTGDQFRILRERQDGLGARVRADYDQGKLMPHWFASYLFENAFLNMDEHVSVVCEGIGRKEPEAQLFDEVATWLGRQYVVCELVVSDEEVIKRQLLRNREDSNSIEKVKVRLDEYRHYTESAINFFRSKNKVIRIDGMGTPEEIQAKIQQALNL